jgi:hypothetical protein
MSMSTSVRLMSLSCVTAIFAQGLASVVAFADPVEYPRSPANAPRGASSTANDAQIAAANRKADEALATAQRALVEAQQALREAQKAPTSRELAPATGTSAQEHLRPIVDGHHVQPRREDVCGLLPTSSDCRGGNTDGVDSDLFHDILRHATP